MATPTRIANNVARFFLTRRFVNYSWKFLHREVNKTRIQNKIKVTFGLLSFPATFLTVMAASGEDNQALIDQVEALYDKKEFDNMYDVLLPHKESKDANVMWRLARASTEKGKALGGDSRKTHIYEAFEYAKIALKLDDTNFACHKWYGILLDYTAEYEGTKQRITNAFTVKEHFLKAIELNPKDATTMYCLGFWCFVFADMPWYQRKVASVVFSTPPTSTYEEAMKHFEDAEKAEPGFYNQNNVMWAKCLLRMKKDKETAKELLQKANAYDAVTEDDKSAKKEAKDMLSKEFGIKV